MRHRSTLLRAFTLIELLVVITVIGILVGLLMTVIHSARLQGQIVETRGLLTTLEQAMARYKQDCGVYPENFESNVKPSFLYYLLETGMGAPYIDKSQLTIESGAATVTADLLDVWGNKLKYYRAPIVGPSGVVSSDQRFEFFNTTAALKTALDAFPGNKQSFNLWSTGPDGVDDSSDTAANKGGDPEGQTGDDIVNWLSK